MRRNTLLIDAGIALVLAILVIVISPGLAVVGLLAILVVLVCAVSFYIDHRRRSREILVSDRRRPPRGQAAAARERSRVEPRGRERRPPSR